MVDPAAAGFVAIDDALYRTATLSPFAHGR
jgi:hypothetical protein